MIKNLLMFLALGQFYTAQSQSIENFENGPNVLPVSDFRNQNGLSFTTQNCDIISQFGNVLNPLPAVNSLTEKATIVLDGTNEPILAVHSIYQNVVPPSGGKFALRLNDIKTGFQDITSYKIDLNPNVPYVSFNYLAVFDSDYPGHALDVQPYFTARLLDENLNIISGTEYCLIAEDTNPILTNYNNHLFYTDKWQCHTLKLPKEYIGKKIYIEFIVADCGSGKDRGVVYIDNITNDKKCSIGTITLDENQYPCPEDKFKVCGTYDISDEYQLDSIYLEIKQNGNVVNTLDMNSLAHFNDGTFCFEVSPSDFPNLSGTFEFKVIANFVDSNSNLITLTYESTYNGPDVLCKCEEENVIPIDYSIENIDYNQDIISWNSFGQGNNYHVQLSQDYACCGNYGYANDNIVVDYYLTTNSFMSEDAGYYYYNNGGSNPKCFRWRVKIDECTWSEWCCVSITGDYDAFDCKTSIYDFFTPSPRPSAKAFPNPTKDFVYIQNSEARIFDVYDLNSQKVKANYFGADTKEIKINITDLKPGIYIIKSNLGEEFKIIKE